MGDEFNRTRRGYVARRSDALSRWSSHAQDEVPLLGGEFAWIVMRTPEWAEAADDLSDNVIYLTERQGDRAAA